MIRTLKVMILLLLLQGCARTASYEGKRPVSTAELHPTSTCWIEQWYCCGPFPFDGYAPLIEEWITSPPHTHYYEDDLFKESFPTEHGTVKWERLSLIDSTALAADLKDRSIIHHRPVRMIDLEERYTPHTVDQTAYALGFVNAPCAMDRQLGIGSDDGIRLWLNGQLIESFDKERPLVQDDDLAFAHFRKGLNCFFVEITNRRGYWGFSIRVRSPDEIDPTIISVDGF